MRLLSLLRKKLAGEAMSDNQVICAEAGGITKDKAAAMDAWKKRFKEKFNTDVQIYAPYVYDSVMVMAAAMQKANSAEPAKYLPELAKSNYDGVTGKIAFAPSSAALAASAPESALA